ncbi:MAG: response regulator transcription factor [Acidimicrobiales bacterium]|nr:response regulator transcription factor [Acidimicrobiales bacterium]
MLSALAVLARGRLQLAEGDPTAAVTTLRTALSKWQELQVPYEVATANTLLGQACRQAGDEQAATRSFARARVLFEQIGAHLDIHIIETRRPRSPAGLTDREIEVLCLIAAGRANKEIAAQLHLSAKTVSRHLTNIFNKLGVNSRTAATAFAYQNQLVGGKQ